MAFYCGVDRFLVEDTITDEAMDTAIYLISKRRHVRRVWRVAFGHGGGDHATVVIHANVQLLPALALLLPVFLASHSP
jgi:hypothetical protein